MRIFIQNMVSLRCKQLVKSELDKLLIRYSYIDSGEVEIVGSLSENKRHKLKDALFSSGLVLMDDKKSMLIERIKNIIVEMIHYGEELPMTKFSDYLAEKLQLDYKQLAAIFSQTKGIAIEHFIKQNMIERVKELILYDELNLTQIAAKMHYSSLAQLTRQFKQITGLTPAYFQPSKVQKPAKMELC